MKVDVSTQLDCSAAKAWSEMQKSALLLHVIGADNHGPAAGPSRTMARGRDGAMPVLCVRIHPDRRPRALFRDHRPKYRPDRDARERPAGQELEPHILDHASGDRPVDLSRRHRHRRRRLDISRLGMGQLVLPASPAPLARPGEDVMSGRSSVRQAIKVTQTLILEVQSHDAIYCAN
jgi:hypothetical protein